MPFQFDQCNIIHVDTFVGPHFRQSLTPKTKYRGKTDKLVQYFLKPQVGIVKSSVCFYEYMKKKHSLYLEMHEITVKPQSIDL